MTDRSTKELSARETAIPAHLIRKWAIGIAVVALGVLLIVLGVGGGGPPDVPAGLPDPGTVTGWGLPVLRLAADLTAFATVGLVLAAAFLLPAKDSELRGVRLRGLRLATWTASAWALVALGQIVLALSDLLGVPPADVLDVTLVLSFVSQTPQGQALLAQALVAALVAIASRWTLTNRGASWLLVLVLAALVPPLLTGHSAASAGHGLAVASLTVHVLAASLWVGGLAGLAWAATAGSTRLGWAVPRFSVLASWCLAAVALSGVANAWLRLADPSQLVTTAYGSFVLAKAAALVVLAGLGWRHRRRIVEKLRGHRVGDSTDHVGAARSFLSLAWLELVIMGATVALAVGLARTPAPAGAEPSDPVAALLGYPLPPAPSLGRMLVGWQPDGFALAFVVLAGSLYLAGLAALRRRGDAWPVGRALSWYAGLLAFGWATFGGLGRYSAVLFSAHMGAHMLLAMLVPVLLVLGAPATLALRTLPGGRVPGEQGPRQLLLAMLHSRAARILTHPLVALAIFVGSFYAVYFTGVFPALMSNHLGHVVMEFHFLLSGALFFHVILGVDPSARRLSPGLRLLMLFLAVPFHAFFSVALMSASTPVAADYFTLLDRPYATDLLADQRLGAGMSWALGELPIVVILIAVFVQWARADQREAARLDRAADRAEAAAERRTTAPR